MNPLYSAALQDHITAKYSITNNEFTGQSSIKSSHAKSYPRPGASMSKRQQQLLRWSKSMKKGKAAIRNTWGAQDEYLDVNPPTLAQRLGVIPHETMSAVEWNEIKEKALFTVGKKTRLECPICVEGFANSKQILLSCGHLYHESCFKSWERLQTLRSCPLCRQSYHRLLTRDAHHIAITQAAICIQSYWRRFVCRRNFLPIWEAHVPVDIKLRRRRLLARLDQPASTWSHGNQTTKSNSMATLFDALDSRNLKAKYIINHGVNELTKNNLQQKKTLFWQRVYRRACDRGREDCPICLTAVNLESKYINVEESVLDMDSENLKRRGIALFQCSHYMHGKCFGSFAKFMQGRQCPCCRGDLKVQFI